MLGYAIKTNSFSNSARDLVRYYRINYGNLLEKISGENASYMEAMSEDELYAKMTTPLNLRSGKEYTHKIIIRNMSENPISNKTFMVMLPGKLGYISSNGGAIYSPAFATLRWILPTLGPSEVIEVQYVLAVNKYIPGGEGLEYRIGFLKTSENEGFYKEMERQYNEDDGL